MEGFSSIVDTTFAVANVASRKVWKPIYPFTLNGNVNFEGPTFSRLIGEDGPREDQVLFEHRAKLREPGVAACLARRPNGVPEMGTISALTPERQGKVVAFACEHGLNDKVFEDVSLTGSLIIDPGVHPVSQWEQGTLDILRAGSDKVYGVEKASYSPLAGAAGHSGAVAQSTLTTAAPATAGATEAHTPLAVGAGGRRRVWQTPDGVFTRQQAQVFTSKDTGRVVWRTPSAHLPQPGAPAAVVAYTGKLDAEYLSDVYDCNQEEALVLLNILSQKYVPFVRCVSPMVAEAFDEEILRFQGSIVRAMSGGIVIQPKDPSKVCGFQIRSRKLVPEGGNQAATPSSIMQRAADGDMASYAMLVSCPWWVCAYCDVVLPALMDVHDDEWPAKDSFSDLNEYLQHHSKTIARVDSSTGGDHELKKKVNLFVEKYNGKPITWG